MARYADEMNTARTWEARHTWYDRGYWPPNRPGYNTPRGYDLGYRGRPSPVSPGRWERRDYVAREPEYAQPTHQAFGAEPPNQRYTNYTLQQLHNTGWTFGPQRRQARRGYSSYYGADLPGPGSRAERYGNDYGYYGISR